MQINLNELKQSKSTKELLEFGIINLDKPIVMTSFDVSNFVKIKLRKAGVRKTSHFGTLDPMVTGVLPIALNRAVKLTGFFLGEDKEYVGKMRLHANVSLEEIQKKIKEKFIGKILQMPPVKSRVKRQSREREIKKFEILKKEGQEVSFAVECQGGTYIRKLVHDLGEQLMAGAHMTRLKRTRAGIFKEEEMTSKEQFEEAVKEYEKGNEKPLKSIIIPAEVISQVYEPVEVKEEAIGKLLHGAPLDDKSLARRINLEKSKIVSVFSGKRFIGMYKVIEEKGIFAKPEFILQPIGKIRKEDL